MIVTSETHPLTWRLRPDRAPVWMDEYRSKQRHNVVTRTVGEWSPIDVTPLVKDAGFRGRGGAGFPTGLS